MAFLYGRRTSLGGAPRWPYSINRDSPFSEGLLACYPLSTNPHPGFDLVQNLIIPDTGLSGTYNFRVSPDINAVGLDIDVSNALSPFDTNFALPDANGITVAFWNFVPDSPGGAPYGFTIGTDLGDDRVGANIPWTDDILYWDYGGTGAGERVSTDYTSFLGSWTHVVLWGEGSSGNGEGQGIQLNGSVATSNANTGAPTTLTDLAIGNLITNLSDSSRHEGSMAFFCIWAGAKSDSFRKALFHPQTRWDLFLQPTRKIYVPSAAVGDTTMVAAQGSYALTGQASNLLWDHLISATQGSYALTGQASNLLWKHLIAAAQGSYSLTGQAAITTKDTPITAAQGSYSLTGQDATLIDSGAGITIIAAQGSYTLTGQASNLLWNHLVAATQGAYTLSGQAAILTKDTPITAAQGSFSLTGQAAILLFNHLIDATQGSYSLTGQAAILTDSGAIVFGGIYPRIRRRRR